MGAEKVLFQRVGGTEGGCRRGFAVVESEWLVLSDSVVLAGVESTVNRGRLPQHRFNSRRSPRLTANSSQWQIFRFSNHHRMHQIAIPD
jgi:hypothetical protein